MAFETLLYQERDNLALVTINRPEKRNALNRKAIGELHSCFQELRSHKTVRSIILTGAGDKAFVAGADIGELSLLTPLEAKEYSRQGQQLLDMIESLGKPVVAAVNGYALGAGCELALACSLRVAAEHASFGQPEVALGLIPGYGGTQRLPRLVGKCKALEMLLSAEPISAAEAYRIGLVNKVVPAQELLPAAEKLARKVATHAPLAIKFVLEAVHQGLETTQREGQLLEANLFALCCTTADMQEGTRAFLEKRPARLEGR